MRWQPKPLEACPLLANRVIIINELNNPSTSLFEVLTMSNQISMSLLVLVATVGWGVFPLVAAEPLRIMSFNIRFGTAADGENHWNKRQTHVATTIADFKPDLVGTQETLQFQADFIHSQLPGYTYFGRSRMKTPNEHCGIFYRTAVHLAGRRAFLAERVARGPRIHKLGFVATAYGQLGAAARP